MSSHTLTPLPGAPAGRTVRIGWDAPLATFYAIAWDEPADEDAEPVHLAWAGTGPYDVSEVDTVVELIAPYAVIPEDLRERLLADQATEGDRFPGRPATELVAECALPQARDSRQADAIRAALH